MGCCGNEFFVEIYKKLGRLAKDPPMPVISKMLERFAMLKDDDNSDQLENLVHSLEEDINSLRDTCDEVQIMACEWSSKNFCVLAIETYYKSSSVTNNVTRNFSSLV